MSLNQCQTTLARSASALYAMSARRLSDKWIGMALFTTVCLALLPEYLTPALVFLRIAYDPR